jgi:hypothetical protein
LFSLSGLDQNHLALRKHHLFTSTSMADGYDLFISYTQKDGEIAADLATRLHEAGLKCFMADRSILAGGEWEPVLRDAIRSSQRVLLLITPRSKASLWVAAEAGAAWVLQKDLLPVLIFVDPTELFEPLRKYQARVAETPQQLERLVKELSLNQYRFQERPSELPIPMKELFNMPYGWERLVKVGQWTFNEASGSIVGEGMYRYLLSDKQYGARPFTIHARLEFLELRPEGEINAVNAGIVLGWETRQNKPTYLHLMFSGKRLLLEQIGQFGGDEYYDFRHIDEGIPFILKAACSYQIVIAVNDSIIEVVLNGRRVYSVAAPRGTVVGRVGLRPWRSRLRCDCFEVGQSESAREAVL